MIVSLSFPADALSAATSVGLPDLPIIILPVSVTAGKSPAELEQVARESEKAIIDSLTKAPVKPVVAKKEVRVASRAKTLTFKGKNMADAQEAMEKSFLQNRMTDGFPLVPPTEEQVKAMIEASGLKPETEFGLMDPRKGRTTVEMVAINAVMAGCRPAYMPVLIAIAEAMVDPNFDAHGVLVTGGLAAPLIIVSGPIIDELNLNNSYSSIGPGWRANSTIGRAMRLMAINIAHTWPGINDMKEVGNPAKFGIVMAENEKQTPPGWGTLREREGFAKTASTVSLFASQSYRQVHDIQAVLAPTIPYRPVIDPGFARVLSTALNALATHWGEEVVIAFSPVTANNLAKLGYTPEKVQEELYRDARVPRRIFGPRPLGVMGQASHIPQWIDEAADDAMIPVVPTPKDFRIVVSGGSGPNASVVIDRWGFGNSKLTTKEIKRPANWANLLKDLEEWKTPIVYR